MIATRAAVRMIHLRMYFHPDHFGGWSRAATCVVGFVGDWTLRSVKCPALSSMTLRKVCNSEEVQTYESSSRL